MPPVRTHDKAQNAEASSSQMKSHSKHKHARHRTLFEKESSATPGVQKVKAALRQTRRLLAKDKLAADVRVETERRLKALEAELQQAELANKERAFAVRYHKIKFFERQKVTRKIKQTLKRLESEESKSEKKKISSQLQELRVDLNYILHYPKMKKYISLFPPEVRKGEEASAPSAADTLRTNAEREEVRDWIRGQMQQDNLPSEPELEVVSQHGTSRAQTQKWPTAGANVSAKTWPNPTEDVEKDDFFGEDDGEKSS